MVEKLKSLLWRVFPGRAHAVSVRLPYLRAYLAYGWNRRRLRAAPLGAPVIVAGFHGAILGLGEASRSLTRLLHRTGRTVLTWDVSERLSHARRLAEGEVDAPADGAGVMIAQVNPVELIHLIAQTDGAPFRGRYTVGYWAWELPRIPKAWRAAFRYVDEVWTLSAFSAEAIRRDAPRRVKVRIMPLVVEESGQLPDRAHFNLPADRVIVLCAFDFRSSIARKNPLGALEAYRRAAARTATPSLLVFKTVGAESEPEAIAVLRAAIGVSEDVRLLTESMSSADKDRLVASCDVLLSVHRAEGFGLFPAEAMAAGKPVIATGWSGNLDYMDEHNAVLLPWRPTPVEDPQGIYTIGHWAEPDLEAAAEALVSLIDDPLARTTLGEKARRAIQHRLSASALAALVTDALADMERAR